MDFFFSENPELDSLEKVPAEFHTFYAQGQDGKYKVDEKFAASATTIDGLRKNFNTTRTNLTAAQQESMQRRQALEAWEANTGVKTADEAKARLDKLTQDLSEGKKINPETIRAELQTQFDAKNAATVAERDAMEASLKEYLLDSAALGAIAELKGNATLLMPHIQRQAQVIKDPVTNKYRAVAVNEKGEPLPDTDGGWLSVAKLVERLKANKDFAACFTVTPPSGGGLPPGGGQQQQRPNLQRPANNGGTGGDQNQRSPMDKISAGLKGRQLPRERAAG
jgi:hypothetical protein